MLESGMHSWETKTAGRYEVAGGKYFSSAVHNSFGGREKTTCLWMNIVADSGLGDDCHWGTVSIKVRAAERGRNTPNPGPRGPRAPPWPPAPQPHRSRPVQQTDGDVHGDGCCLPPPSSRQVGCSLCECKPIEFFSVLLSKCSKILSRLNRISVGGNRINPFFLI